MTVAERWLDHPELTDVCRADVQARAADITFGLARQAGLPPILLGALLDHLATPDGRYTAAVALVERFGYVSQHPTAFLDMKREDELWPTGF